PRPRSVFSTTRLVILIVSPAKTGSRKFQTRTRSIAIVRTGGVNTPRPLPIEKTAKPCAIGRRNGVGLANSASMWIGLKSPLKPGKLTMSVSVIVRPPDVHSWPTSRSSKYRWIEEKLMEGSQGRYARGEPASALYSVEGVQNKVPARGLMRSDNLRS